MGSKQETSLDPSHCSHVLLGDGVDHITTVGKYTRENGNGQQSLNMLRDCHVVPNLAQAGPHYERVAWISEARRCISYPTVFVRLGTIPRCMCWSLNPLAMATGLRYARKHLGTTAVKRTMSKVALHLV